MAEVRDPVVSTIEHYAERFLDAFSESIEMDSESWQGWYSAVRWAQAYEALMNAARDVEDRADA